MSNKLSAVSIADLLAFAKQLQEKPKKVANPPTTAERKTPSGKPWYVTDEERAKIERLRATGVGIGTISRKVGRSEKVVRAVVRAIKPVTSPAIAKPSPVIAQSVEDGMAEVAGLGSIKRSMERLHDRMSKVDTRFESHNIRLSDITAAVAKLQQSVDRITREFVNTNPPPAEIALPPIRVNGHRQ